MQSTLPVTAVAVALLSGCALTDLTDTRALINSNAGEIQTVATRADRRIAFIDRNWMWGEDRKRDNVAYRMTVAVEPSEADQTLFESYQPHHYCVEPSPDVSEDLLTELIGQLGAGRRHSDGGVGFSRSVEAVTDPVFSRSQGVQLFRDGLFALCQAHHNGAVGGDSYGDFVGVLLERSSYLIALELALAPLIQQGKDGTSPDEGEIANVLSILKEGHKPQKPPAVAPGTMAQSERSAQRGHMF